MGRPTNFLLALQGLIAREVRAQTRSLFELPAQAVSTQRVRARRRERRPPAQAVPKPRRALHLAAPEKKLGARQ